MDQQTAPVQKLAWRNISFFIVTTLVAVVGAPLYVMHYGLTGGEVALMLFYMAATALGITVGYHRLFAHRNFKASRLVRFLVLFFGAAAFEQSALKWACQHRSHHKYVDTDLDPYNIKKGFFYAHMGWLMFWRHKVNFDIGRDLQESKLMMHQHKYYPLWSLGAGIVTPVIFAANVSGPLAPLVSGD